MSKPNTAAVRRLLALFIVGVLASAGWMLGTRRVAYVVTNGVSMHPVYYAGDLVVLAKAGSYRPGQIVAYHGVPTGHLTVLHRIIGADATGFVLKGDNNQSIDPTHPRASDVIGRAVLHIPKAGAAAQSPITRALFALVLLALLGALVVNRQSHTPEQDQPPPPSLRSGRVWKALIVLDVVLVVAIGAVFAVGSGPSGPTKAPFTQTGSLSYRADVTPSDTYPTGRVTTGDPVFTKVLDKVAVTFRYGTDAPSTSVRGSAQLAANLETSSGWHTVLPLADSTPVTGGAAHLQGTLDLAAIESLVAGVAKATGVPSSTIDVTVIGSADLSVDGAPSVPYRSQLQLHLSAPELTYAGGKPAPSDDGPALVSTVALSPASPIAPRVPGRSSHNAKRLLIAALLLAVGGTAALWPSPKAANAAAIPIIRTRALSVRPGATTHIRVAGRQAIEQLAADLTCPIIESDEGWEAVVSPGALYWTVTTPHAADSEMASAPTDVPLWQHRPPKDWASMAGRPRMG